MSLAVDLVCLVKVLVLLILIPAEARSKNSRAALAYTVLLGIENVRVGKTLKQKILSPNSKITWKLKDAIPPTLIKPASFKKTPKWTFITEEQKSLPGHMSVKAL